MEISNSVVKMSEDDDALQPPRNKTMVFTLDERKLLLKLVNMHFDVLNNKKVDSASSQLKNQAWEAIHKKYLENTGLVKLPRTPQQLKRCWENMKCKAKKGDPMSMKLIRWGEAQYKLMQSGRENKNQDKTNDFFLPGDSFEEDSDIEIKEDFNNCESKVKLEEAQNAANQLIDNSFSKIKEALENSKCVHCTCDKLKKTSKVELLELEKQHNEELHQIKMQLVKDRIKREKELHRLHIHEMTLKVENERRRAEILERELNNQD